MDILWFDPSSFLREIKSLQQLIRQYLEPGSVPLLSLWEEEIKGLMVQGGQLPLRIPEGEPLQTRVSKGEFEPPEKSSSRPVFGRITGIWEIEILEVKVPDPVRPNKKAKSRKVLNVTGKASTEFKVLDARDESCLAWWKMELGNAESPGFFFHTFASPDPKFPVPRHPNLFATPMAAIGFAVGELFHAAWEQSVKRDIDAARYWRSLQKDRLEKLLDWQLRVVQGTRTSSPWCRLRQAKPDKGLFL
jgi:hypothetical protein